jgi:glutamate synthase (NADPH/NADH) small chain
VEERLHDWFEIYEPFPEEKQREQGARCMDCGVPFCHTGCPVNNLIPTGTTWSTTAAGKQRVRRLHATNNFPEFTGRICPAPCEAACVLGINQPPVSIKLIEKSIVERGWEEGWIRSPSRRRRTPAKRVAVVGSGPAGLAAAQQLRRAGHSVTVYEKNDRIGGLMRYGIPNFKLEKWVLDRRIEQMRAEGVTFHHQRACGRERAGGRAHRALRRHLLAGGAEQPRNLNIPGRELKGIHFAMEFLPQQNRRCEGDAGTAVPRRPGEAISARASVWSSSAAAIPARTAWAPAIARARRACISLRSCPSRRRQRAASTPWPLWPLQLRTEGAHEEGGIRDWSINSVKFTGDEDGNVKELHLVRVGPPPKFEAIAGSEHVLEVDLVLLAMGFLGPVRNGMIEQLGLAVDNRGNVAANADYMTSVDGIFARRRHAPRAIAGGVGDLGRSARLPRPLTISMTVTGRVCPWAALGRERFPAAIAATLRAGISRPPTISTSRFMPISSPCSSSRRAIHQGTAQRADERASTGQ